MKNPVNKLLLIYYSLYVLAIVFAVLGYYFAGGQYDFPGTEQPPAAVTFTSIYIIYLIVSIPLSLKLFNNQVKKLAENQNSEEKIKKYTSYSMIRLAVIGSSLLIGILFFYLFNSKSMIFCAGIAAIALVFCKPSEMKMASELETYDDEPEK